MFSLHSIIFFIVVTVIVFICAALCIPLIVKYFSKKRPSVLVRELENNHLVPILTNLYTKPNDITKHTLFIEKVDWFFGILRRRFYNISYSSGYLMSKIIRHTKKYPEDELGFARASAFINGLKDTDTHDLPISNSLLETAMESINYSPLVFDLVMLCIPRLYRLNLPVLKLPEIRLINSLLSFTYSKKMIEAYIKVINYSTVMIVSKGRVYNYATVSNYPMEVQQSTYFLVKSYVTFVLEYFQLEQVRTNFLDWIEKNQSWFLQDHIIAILAMLQEILTLSPDNESVHKYIYSCIRQIKKLASHALHPIRHTFYEKILDVLQEHPDSVNLRKFALEFGRWHFFLYNTPLIYDEARLQNDISIRTMQR